MTPEEEAKQKAMLAALAPKPLAPAPVAVQAAPAPKPPPGSASAALEDIKNGKVSGSNVSTAVTKNVTRGAAAAGSWGLSEIPIGGQGIGERVGNAAAKVDAKVNSFFKALDPTNVKMTRASTGGIDTAQGGITAVGTKAGGLAQALAANPVTSQQVQVAMPGNASTVMRQDGIVADRIAGQLPTVQAQQARMQSVDPAMIAELERMNAAQINRGEDQQVRSSQMGLIEALQGQANGTAPSLAEQQLKRSNEQTIASQMAQAASARGGNPAMAQRMAAQNIAGLQADAAGRAAELRIQEQTAARQQLTQALDSTRGQDVTVASQQAQLAQQAAQVNKTASDQAALAQAQLIQQAALANQGEFGQTQRFNVEQDTGAQKANQSTLLQGLTADQGASLDAQKATAANTINVDQFNAKATDEMARFSTDARLRADVANQAAALQAQGMTVDSIAKFMGLEQDSLKAVLASETAKFTSEQATLNAESEKKSNMLGNVVGTVAQVIAMCFPAGTPISMMDGSTTPIEDIEIGDMVSGGAVLGTRKQLVNERLYDVGGVLMTGSHAVFEGGKAVYARDVSVPAHTHVGLVYNIVTSTHRMWVKGIELGDDTVDAGGAVCN